MSHLPKCQNCLIWCGKKLRIALSHTLCKSISKIPTWRKVKGAFHTQLPPSLWNKSTPLLVVTKLLSCQACTQLKWYMFQPCYSLPLVRVVRAHTSFWSTGTTTTKGQIWMITSHACHVMVTAGALLLCQLAVDGSRFLKPCKFVI